MLEAQRSKSFSAGCRQCGTPLRSVYYIFKTMVVLLGGQFRPRLREGEGR